MAKLVTFFLIVFTGMAILSGIMEGGGGIVATQLNGDLTAAATTVIVDDVDGYLSADYIVIGDEQILYTGTTTAPSPRFTGCTRGYGGTEAVAHADDSRVYTASASAINNALGFNIAATADSMGLWATITVPWNFLSKTMPRIIMLNWSFLAGELAILAYFFFAAAAGLIITLALYLAGGRRV